MIHYYSHYKIVGSSLLLATLSRIPKAFGTGVRLWWICVLLIILSCGCSTVSEARRIQKEEMLSSAWGGVKSSEIGLSNGSVLPLQRSIEIALQYNPTLIQSKERLNSAEAILTKTEGNYYPQVNSSGSYRKRTTNTSSTNTSSKTSGSYSADLSINQQLYDFGKTPALVRKAYYDYQSAEYDLRQAENNLVFSVKENYHNVQKQTSVVRLSEETVKQYEKYLEQARAFFEVGTRIKYDITKAEVNLGNAQLNLINARNALSLSRQILLNTLGFSDTIDYQLEDLSLDIKETGVPAYEIEALFQLAKDNNPELKSQQARVQSSSAEIDYVIASLLPSLSLAGILSFSGSDFPLVWNRTLSSILNLDIFKGGQKENEIRSAVANLRSARASSIALEQRLYLDIARAKNQMVDAAQKLAINNKILQQAQENLNLIEERYRIGKASAVELTDAQVSLSKGWVDQIQAQFDYRSALALIEKVAPLPSGSAPKTIGEK
ncbi:MAG: TolC family protein [Planctomycetota bacterium]|nr:TolC family protein [Planctomycetota bacterium]MDI6787291.1 TolC family protein [Planctomycetota bacterium]